MNSILHSQNPATRIAFATMLAVAVLSIARHAWPDPGYFPVDFKYFWLAGKLWNSGVSPYGPDLKALGSAAFPGERINPFFYPPSWRLIVAPLAALPPAIAETLWAVLSGCAILLAAWICANIAKILYPAAPSRFRLFALIAAAVAAGAHAVKVSIQIGQPALFDTAGSLALLAAGLIAMAAPKGRRLALKNGAAVA